MFQITRGKGGQRKIPTTAPSLPVCGIRVEILSRFCPFHPFRLFYSENLSSCFALGFLRALFREAFTGRIRWCKDGRKGKFRRTTKWPKLFRCCSSVFPSQQWRPVVTFERHPAAFGRLFFLFGIGSPLRESSSTNRVWPIQKRLYRSCSSCSFYFTALCANWPED